jgi:sialate O-acetylesterase
LIVTVFLAGLCPVAADVRLHGLFTDHMVLQQGRRVPVWGWADDGERVTVTFRGETRSATARDGRWKVELGRLEAGGPDTLTVRGKNTIELADVLVGEVWICSGQSNMEWPISRSHEPQAALDAATHPQLRLFTVPKLKSDLPVDNVQSEWKLCVPENVAGFSAVAYYFGRDLQEALGVPVGLIHTSWGGSPAEVWMREEVLMRDRAYREQILDTYRNARLRHEAEDLKWEGEAEAARTAGREFNRPRPRAPWKPSELYNGMIAPLIPHAIRGAIWYQGESNAGRAHQYRRLFPDMIRNWRRDWDQGNFPFLFVQLAPWDKNRRRPIEEIAAAPVESDWAELREAQLMTLDELRHTGMAVITDYGDKDDIHPPKKEPVGARLALAARAIAYGEDIVYSGPVFKRMRVRDGRAVLTFDHVGGGLVARDGDLKGFTIAGEDRAFVWAEARIDGDQVIVSSPEVAKPVAVRLGWADYPVVNLYNEEGLPASPFRTDDFPMVTGPKE